jgi:hypothetical protein
MKKVYLLIAAFFFIFAGSALAQDGEVAKPAPELKRHKVGAFLGNSLIHGVHNTQTGKEQYVLAPTFGIDYEYWINHKWAIGTYNEVAHFDIEVKTEEHEEFIKRENALLFSAVVLFEPIHHLGIFAGTGIETDPHHTFWIRYMGLEYTIIRCNDWDVALSAGYVNKAAYDAFTFGVVIGRRFGKNIPSRGHH